MLSNSKSTRSRGQRGPSQQKPKAAKRRSKRGRRRRVAQSARMSDIAPAAVSMPNRKVYHRSGAAPKHKEWGEGTRFNGVTRLGIFSNNASSSDIYVPAQPPNSTLTWWNLYGYYFNFISIPGDFFQPLHPFFIPRLSAECYNFARYVFRSATIHFDAVAPSSNGNGYSISLVRDLSAPFALSSFSSDSDIRNIIEQQENITVGSFWKSTSVELIDFKGERTWPLNVPYVYSGDSILPEAGTLATVAETYYQAVFGTIAAGASSSSTIPFLGNIYIEYQVDLYVPRFTDAITIQIGAESASTASSSSSSLSSTSFNSPGFQRAHDMVLRRHGIDRSRQKDSKTTGSRVRRVQIPSSSEDQKTDRHSGLRETVGSLKVGPSDDGDLIKERPSQTYPWVCSHCFENPCKDEHCD
jgi:hypothetical protein